MKCIVAEFSGFCHGVKNTINAIDELLEKKTQNVYCIGHPVHNPQVTERLVAKGLRVIQSLAEANDGILVVRAHGLPPKIITEAEQKNLKVVDTTCGIVRNAQRIARMLYEEGYTVVIVGEENHPEVLSVYGMTDEQGIIYNAHPSSVKKLGAAKRIGILSQTTYSQDKFKSIVNEMLQKGFDEVREFNTICDSIARRSGAACRIAKEVDCMFIVGGKMSSNTKRLYEACKAMNTQSYHIETKDDIANDLLSGVKTTGVTAGASTPDWLIHDVVAYLQAYR